MHSDQKLYSFINVNNSAGLAARIGEKRNAYWLLVGKPEGKIPLGRPGSRWVDNIKKDLGQIG
jgi:hypothetical protein